MNVEVIKTAERERKKCHVEKRFFFKRRKKRSLIC